MSERTTIVVRLTPLLAKKIERLTRESRKQLGSSWSRNDQICFMLHSYEAPEKGGGRDHPSDPH